MESKWFVIMFAMLFSTMFGGMAYDSHVKIECRKAFAQTNKTASDIVLICGK